MSKVVSTRLCLQLTSILNLSKYGFFWVKFQVIWEHQFAPNFVCNKCNIHLCESKILMHMQLNLQWGEHVTTGVHVNMPWSTSRCNQLWDHVNCSHLNTSSTKVSDIYIWAMSRSFAPFGKLFMCQDWEQNFSSCVIAGRAIWSRVSSVSMTWSSIIWTRRRPVRAVVTRKLINFESLCHLLKWKIWAIVPLLKTLKTKLLGLFSCNEIGGFNVAQKLTAIPASNGHQ